jgi:hypothetical protein
MTVDGYIAHMMGVYGSPNTLDDDIFLAATRKALAGWRGDILAEAAERIVKTHKWFPKPAEVIDVCEAIAAGRTTNADPTERNRDWTADALKTADRLIQSDMGRTAAAEGWITQLHDYARKHRSLPKPSVVHRLKHDARDFEAAYADVCAGRGGVLETALKKLGETMLAKRVQLAQIANGEAPSGLTDLSRRMSGDDA